MSKITYNAATGDTNCVVDQNADFTMTVTYTAPNGAPINLSGFTAEMMIRPGYADPAVITLTETSGITLGGSAGTVVVFTIAAQNSPLTANKSYVYDLVLTNSGAKTRLIAGSYFIDPGVTR